MIPLESENEAACRLTNGKVLSVPKGEDNYTVPDAIVTCTKSGLSFCSESCRAKADLAYDRMLLPLRAKLGSFNFKKKFKYLL